MPFSSPRAAFTLIEVVIALAIFVVILAIGWGSMRDYLPRFRLVGSAKDLRSDLMNLRNLAVQTGHETRLRLTSSPGDCSDTDTWGGAWELSVGDRSSGSTSWDLLPADPSGTDEDQTLGTVDIGEAGNRKARDICLADWGTLRGPGTDNDDSVVFSPRGWVSNPGGDFSTTGYIELVLVNQVAAAGGVDDRITLQVSRGGMVRMVPSLGAAANESTVGTGTSSHP